MGDDECGQLGLVDGVPEQGVPVPHAGIAVELREERLL
jgi:hypothetical protein